MYSCQMWGYRLYKLWAEWKSYLFLHCPSIPRLAIWGKFGRWRSEIAARRKITVSGEEEVAVVKMMVALLCTTLMLPMRMIRRRRIVQLLKSAETSLLSGKTSVECRHLLASWLLTLACKLEFHFLCFARLQSDTLSPFTRCLAFYLYLYHIFIFLYMKSAEALLSGKTSVECRHLQVGISLFVFLRDCNQTLSPLSPNVCLFIPFEKCRSIFLWQNICWVSALALLASWNLTFCVLRDCNRTLSPLSPDVCLFIPLQRWEWTRGGRLSNFWKVPKHHSLVKHLLIVGSCLQVGISLFVSLRDCNWTLSPLSPDVWLFIPPLRWRSVFQWPPCGAQEVTLGPAERYHVLAFTLNWGFLQLCTSFTMLGQTVPCGAQEVTLAPTPHWSGAMFSLSRFYHQLRISITFSMLSQTVFCKAHSKVLLPLTYPTIHTFQNWCTQQCWTRSHPKTQMFTDPNPILQWLNSLNSWQFV